MSGTTSANLAFASNAATSVVTEALSGTGAAAPTHSVDLSWDASSTVAGYNVYRGNQASGPFAKVNSTLDATTTYTDTSVQAGSTYYYVATAVDGSGAESAYSAAVSVVIPMP
jgi:fibronectin type 3 domain-containing protein